MGKLSKRSFNDVGKRTTQVAYLHKGERRIDKRPAGKVERFVDPAGHVVSILLGNPGSVTMEADAVKARTEHHNNGFVEHHKCPLKHGIRFAAKKIEADFVELPTDLQRPCDHDTPSFTRTRPGGPIEARDGCAHIQWLVAFRTERERARNEEMNAARTAAEAKTRERDELQTIQLEMAREELAKKQAERAEREAKKKSKGEASTP